jgi:hypothetical protein
MVKLTGPGLSTDASGSIADVVTFSRTKHRNYLKKHAGPKQPRTPPQLSIRALIAFLSSEWQLLTSTHQATWKQLVPKVAPTPYHSYISINMQRWRSWKPPSKSYPATETGIIPSSIHHSATGGFGLVELTMNNPTTPYPWGYLIFRDTVSMPAQRWDRLVHAIRRDPAATTTHRDTPLDPGTYYYRFSGFSDNGIWRHAATERTAVVT